MRGRLWECLAVDMEVGESTSRDQMERMWLIMEAARKQLFAVQPQH